ncbi:hypothetical protein RI367_001070 [Sorochytrium milnesiophthora]
MPPKPLHINTADGRIEGKDNSRNGGGARRLSSSPTFSPLTPLFQEQLLVSTPSPEKTPAKKRALSASLLSLPASKSRASNHSASSEADAASNTLLDDDGAMLRSPARLTARLGGQRDFSVQVDEGVLGGISVSPTNRDVVLVGRRGLLIIDLDNPFEDPRLLSYETPNNAWRKQLSCATQVQWCPHLAKESYIASTFNHSVFVWNLNMASFAASTTSSPSTTPPSTPKSVLSPFPPAPTAPYSLQGLTKALGNSLQQPPLSPHPHQRQRTVSSNASPSPGRQLTSSGTSGRPLAWSNVETVLTGHTQAITNLDWSSCQPDILASCALDSFVLMWDLRRPARPANAFSAWHGGSTHVKWNPKNTWILASSHSSKIFLWDIRKGSVPLTVMNAHSSSVFDIAWSHANENELVSSSRDKTVKFWNIIEPERCQDVIELGSAAWRTKYTPFGLGVAVVPQEAGSVGVSFWNRSDLSRSVFETVGSSSGVAEIDWRACTAGDADRTQYQMLTWSRDRVLQLWTLDNVSAVSAGDMTASGGSIWGEASVSPLAHLSEPHPGLPVIAPRRRSKRVRSYRDQAGQHNNLRASKQLLSPRQPNHSSTYVVPSLTGTSATATTQSDEMVSQLTAVRRTSRRGNEPGKKAQAEESTGQSRSKREGLLLRNLKEEIVWISGRYSNVKFDKVDIPKRTCSLILRGPWGNNGCDVMVQANFQFPEKYPDMYDAPSVELPNQGDIPAAIRQKLYQSLNDIIERNVSRARPCLEACIRYLLGQSGQKLQDTQQPGDSEAITARLPQSPDFLSSDDLGANESDSNDDDVMDSLAWSGDEDLADAPRRLKARAASHSSSIHGQAHHRTTSHKRVLKSDGVRAMVRDGPEKSDQNVPFPRLCSAVWSPGGKLVYFFSSFSNVWKTAPKVSSDSQVLQQNITTHPRSYEAFDMFRAKVDTPAVPSRSGSTTDSLGRADAAGMSTAADSGADDTMLTAPDVPSDEESSDNNSRDEADALLQNPSLFYRPSKVDLSQDILHSFRPRPLSQSALKDLGSLRGPLRRRSSGTTRHYLGSVSSAGSTSMLRERDRDSLTHDMSVGELFLKASNAKQTHGGKPVYIRDLSAMMPSSRELAYAYGQHPANPVEACGQYAAAARSLGRFDLVRVWTLAQMVLAQPLRPPPQPHDSVMRRPHHSSFEQSVEWGAHPFGRQCVEQIFRHYERLRDVQTLALLSCVFAESPSVAAATAGDARQITAVHVTLSHASPATTPSASAQSSGAATSSSRGKEPTVTAPPTTATHITFSALPTAGYKDGVPVTSQHTIVRRSIGRSSAFDLEARPSHVPLLDPKKQHVYDSYKLAYCELLFCWDQLHSRAVILKFVRSPPVNRHELETGLFIRCPFCYMDIRAGTRCAGCERVRQLRCEICHLHVRGLALFCPNCGHGGHDRHLQEWFGAAGNKVCPVGGCGCRCATMMGL